MTIRYVPRQDALILRVNAKSVTTPLSAPALDTCDRLESGPGLVELDRLVLCRLGAGSGVPLLGKSSSTITSLLSF